MEHGLPEPLSRQACVVRHVAFEDLGTFGAALSAAGYDLSIMDAGVDDLFEPMIRSDLVIVLGGPIGVYEEDRYPFLAEERRFRNLAVLEKYLRGARRLYPQLMLKLPYVDAGRIHVDYECRYAVVFLGRVGRRYQDHNVRFGSVGYPGFCPVYDIGLPLLHRGCPHASGV